MNTDASEGSGSKPARTVFVENYPVSSLSDLIAISLVAILYWALGLLAFQTHSAVFRGIMVYFVGGTAVFFIFASDFWKVWTFWLPKDDSVGPGGRREAIKAGAYGAIAALLLLVSMFAVVSAQWSGVLRIGSAHASENLVWSYTVGYVWNVVDAIPVLQINETIHWVIPSALFSAGGGEAAVILFRLLVVLPVLSLVARAIEP